MTEERRNIVTSAKNLVVDAVKGVGDSLQAAVDTVSGTLVSALKGVGAITQEATNVIFDTVRGVIQGVADTGQDLTKAAKGIMIGLVRATGETGTETMGAIETTASAVVKSTAEVGGDIVDAAKGNRRRRDRRGQGAGTERGRRRVGRRNRRCEGGWRHQRLGRGARSRWPERHDLRCKGRCQSTVQ